MEKYYCDRCGKALDATKRNQIRILDFNVSNDFIKKDLCDSCTRGLWNFLNKKRVPYHDIYREDF